MEYRLLGRSGLKVSALSLGTMTFGRNTPDKPLGSVGPEEARRHIDLCLDHGVNLIDTANVYTRGQSEEIIGEALAGRRDTVVLATKARFNMHGRPNTGGNSRINLIAECERSLKRLRTDWIDLYQVHQWDGETPVDETVEALDALVRSGKVRYVGCSNFLAYRLARAIGVSETRRLVRFDCVQPRYNLLFREFERELLPLCSEEGIGVIPYNPIAGGMLSGKHDRSKPPAEGTRFTLGNAARTYTDRYWHDNVFDTVDELAKIADHAGMALPTLAVAWVLQHPAITSPIVGASRPEQLDATIAAVDTKLDADLVERLNEVTAAYRRGDAPR